MPQWRPDQSFCPSPKMAMEAQPEKFAYVAMLNPQEDGKDAMGVIELDPASDRYGQLIGRVEMRAARFAEQEPTRLLARHSGVRTPRVGQQRWF